MMVWGTPIDILKKAIFKSLFRDDFEPPIKTLEFDHSMLELRKVKMLSMEVKLMHYKWLADHIIEVNERTDWVIGATIYKPTLSLTSKEWLSIVRHCIVPTSNDNILSVEKDGLVVAF